MQESRHPPFAEEMEARVKQYINAFQRTKGVCCLPLAEAVLVHEQARADCIVPQNEGLAERGPTFIRTLCARAGMTVDADYTLLVPKALRDYDEGLITAEDLQSMGQDMWPSNGEFNSRRAQRMEKQLAVVWVAPPGGDGDGDDDNAGGAVGAHVIADIVATDDEDAADQSENESDDMSVEGDAAGAAGGEDVPVVVVSDDDDE